MQANRHGNLPESDVYRFAVQTLPVLILKGYFGKVLFLVDLPLFLECRGHGIM